MELPFSEMKKTAGRAGVREKIRGLSLDKFEMPTEVSSICFDTLEYSKELKRRPWPRDIN